MLTVKLPDMEWNACNADTECMVEGHYVIRQVDNGNVRQFVRYIPKNGCMFRGWQYAGPITFDIPEPIPELVQLDGHRKPLSRERQSDGSWSCETRDFIGDYVVYVVHSNQRTAILAHNAAVRVMMEHSK